MTIAGGLTPQIFSQNVVFSSLQSAEPSPVFMRLCLHKVASRRALQKMSGFETEGMLHMSGGRNLLPKLVPISLFQAYISFLRCFNALQQGKS